jgi:uncharacterized membrane protein
MKKLSIFSTLLILTLFALCSPSDTVFAETPEARAILFYSPSCGHCYQLITEDLPPILEKYQDSLFIVGVDVSTIDGQQLYQASIETFKIPENRIGVPTLIIGDNVLVGGREIPEQFPRLIDQYLDAGGVDWPSIPGFSDWLNVQLRAASATQQPETTDTAEPATPVQTQNENPNPDSPSAIENNSGDSFGILDRIKRDPAGNAIAILTLVGLVGVVIISAAYFLGEKSVALKSWQEWLMVPLGLIGLGVSIYLSFIEVTKTEAVCGPVGDCNTVQSSQYAVLFGLVPVGILGILGYLLILISWISRIFTKNRLRSYATIIVWGMAWFGVLFSIYLTFLEPFVIGATCMWCISSAVIMGLMLLISTPAAKNSFEQMDLESTDLDPELLEQ